AVCAMLRRWLQPASTKSEVDEQDIAEGKQASLLWSGGFGVLPRGNYPVLEALLHGYLKREPPCADEWLDVLEKHLELEENLDVWRALARHLHLLCLATSVERSERFIAGLVDRLPSILACVEGVAFIARSHRWFPEELTHKCLGVIKDSDWQLKGQAVGELAMLRSALAPADTFCRAIVQDA